MQKIANPDNWYAQSDLMTNAEMNTAFLESIIESRRDCSPRVVDYRQGKMSGGAISVEERIHVNRRVEQIIFRVTALEGELLPQGWALYKDSIQISADPSFDTFSLRYVVQLPLKLPDGTFLDEGGEWTMRFRGTDDDAYEFVAIAEDKYLRTDLTIADGEMLYAGDTIPVQIKVELNGIGVPNAAVRAVLLQPGDDFGDLAAQTNVGPLGADGQTLRSRGLRKIDRLLSDSAFVSNLTATRTEINLSYAGKGTYTGVFPGNIPSGTYRVVGLIDGYDDGFGRYEGWETQYTLLDFSRPEEIALQASVPASSILHTVNSYSLIIKPANKFKRLLGPGQSHRIRMRGNTTQRDAEIVDLLTGSYKIIVPVGSDEEIVTLWVGDQIKPVYTGPLKDLVPVKGPFHGGPFGISLHAGVALPLPDLSPVYKTSTYSELDLTYRFNNYWSIEAIGGYYTFSKKYNMAAGSLYARYTTPGVFGNHWNLHFAGGPGVFKPKNEPVTFGFGLSAGAGFWINPHVELDLDLGYHNLPDPGYAFGTAGLGLHYFF